MSDQTTKSGDLSGRLHSLDALRGFDMFWIIGGGAFFRELSKLIDHPAAQSFSRQLHHVKWEGFHFEDLIFPLFLFIVGAVMPFAISRRLERGQRRSQLYLHIFKRTAVIIVLGMIYNGLLNFDFANMRWAGVLQRIGLCYFLAAVVVMNTSWRGQAIVFGAILVLYCLASAFIPVPRPPDAGVFSMEGCLSSFVDQKLLPGVLYYGFGDNEGLLSTLPATATVLLGTLAGHWLRTNRSGHQKTALLILAGIASLALGKIWALWFPIIKIIWTSSYVLYAGGFSLLLLAIFYWIIDVMQFTKWAIFFVVIGTNALTIYFLQDVINFDGIASYLTDGLWSIFPTVKPVLAALSILAVKWLFLWFLYRRRIFFKA